MTARSMTLAMMTGGALLVAAPVWSEHAPRFIWNASASLPIGLYSVAPATGIAVTDVAIVQPPDELATFLAERGYLPRGVPLLKRVFALHGDTVCREGRIIIAYGGRYAVARAHDSRGRPLPVWQGCRTLQDGEVFLMNWDAPDSFDSRYFGPLPVKTIVGRAIPVWTTDDTDPATDDTSARPADSEP
ncbi:MULTISPECIES: S26 family signal peptidase [unclassified Nitrobacter]|uniref:S26 family signal peptidase n=1 Tax=unclassified Nitrobacter TaxID=2620411 RepID=UPI00092A2E47|nr:MULTISPECIES: S26 family signal peptidase [unclassified Nitrobacter]MBN9147912.1 S26 family signal peptidase [Nitrobacter sp.]MBN9489926.1 S26 family signal peptidase [Alphaproteobacteria bacterium]OJV01408.1 MAG: peptidase [Nitrobacter sp. 62-23]